eukprot:TRINITY_DN21440_c0_g1_i1.p1 TRINITY_DN21440_c0_g1~~TRINITY_DN21440_c0_g1_i1.p1  ORF type:complete len:246 (+),score=58.52 TRINITY_DN21440_c0_g1_i1:66-803(+)
MIWSWCVYTDIRNKEGDPVYDSANRVWYTHECNVNRTELVGWWLLNALMHTIMLILMFVSEVFYWAIAPHSPGAALTTCDQGFVRSLICVLWLAWAILELISGTFMFWTADELLCQAGVEQGRALLILQYIWLPLHCSVCSAGPGSDVNRAACWRRWCLLPKSRLTDTGDPDKLQNWSLDFHGWRLIRKAHEEREAEADAANAPDEEDFVSPGSEKRAMKSDSAATPPSQAGDAGHRLPFGAQLV